MMTLLLSVIAASLLMTLSIAESQDTEPWELSWPFFEGEAASHSIIGGYGDWCDLAEGLHPGLDFGAEADDIVLLPTDETRVVIYLGGNIEDGFCMIFGENSSSTEGWGITHLNIEEPDDWPFEPGSVVDNHQPLANCMSTSLELGLHMHLQWVEFPVEFLPPGLHNPFDYFEDDLIGYDEVQFNPVKWEEYLSPPGNRGIWFILNIGTGDETYDQFCSDVDPNDFQNVIFGAVDIAVAPFSAYQGLSNRDSAGVYSVAYEILKQNPISQGYVSASSGMGDFGIRTLFEMRDELPNLLSPEYRAIYSDGVRRNSSSQWKDPNWWYYMNAYIVTDCGAEDPSTWDSGFDNVWTDTYNNDWDYGICRGAWDTFLAKEGEGVSGNPTLNSEAFFPDGRYAVDITAESQGSRVSATRRLPAENIELPESPENIRGVIVDNFIPSIEEIRVFSYILGDPENPASIIYTEEWEYVQSNNSRNRTSSEYGYLGSANRGLGIAVRYSESMDPQNMGYYWFTGESPYGIAYSSIDDRSRWLRPVEYIRDGLGIDPSSIESEYWKCYETVADCSLDELGYIGKLAFHTGGPASPGIVRDLAGNEMDYDPRTIVPPRDPSNGDFDYTNADAGPYDTEIWAESPTWNHDWYTDIVYGSLEDELKPVASVDLNAKNLAFADFIGDCWYWCGFWMRWSEPGVFNEHWPMVDFQGNYIELIVYTEFPVVTSGLDQYWKSVHFHEPVSSPDTRYMWTDGYTMDKLAYPHPDSEGIAYCLDSETYAVQEYHLCTGWIWDDTQGRDTNEIPTNIPYDEYVSADNKGWIAHSFTEILSVDIDGIAEVRYGYYTAPDYGAYVEDFVFIDPNAEGGDHLEISVERPLDRHGTGIAPTISSNPAHSTFTVSINTTSGSAYEIDLYDIAGRRVLSESGISVQDRFSIDVGVSNIPSGVYLLRISSGEMEVIRTISIIH